VHIIEANEVIDVSSYDDLVAFAIDSAVHVSRGGSFDLEPDLRLAGGVDLIGVDFVPLYAEKDRGTLCLLVTHLEETRIIWTLYAVTNDARLSEPIKQSSHDFTSSLWINKDTRMSYIDASRSALSILQASPQEILSAVSRLAIRSYRLPFIASRRGHNYRSASHNDCVPIAYVFGGNGLSFGKICADPTGLLSLTSIHGRDMWPRVVLGRKSWMQADPERLLSPYPGEGLCSIVYPSEAGNGDTRPLLSPYDLYRQSIPIEGTLLAGCWATSGFDAILTTRWRPLRAWGRGDIGILSPDIGSVVYKLSRVSDLQSLRSLPKGEWNVSDDPLGSEWSIEEVGRISGARARVRAHSMTPNGRLVVFTLEDSVRSRMVVRIDSKCAFVDLSLESDALRYFSTMHAFVDGSKVTVWAFSDRQIRFYEIRGLL
jgi:hypothetical protein